jgi:glyoxylate/hydroxypyruvate reductase A
MAVLVDIKDDRKENWLPLLKSELPGEEIVWREDAVASARDLDDIEFAVVWAPHGGTLKRVSNLKAIFSMGAGVDHILGVRGLPENVPIVRFVDPDLTNRMSEWVVLQCLMHLRQQRRYDEQQDRKMWNPLSQPIASEITVGILGLGVLGADAARKLALTGFSVAGWSRTPKNLDGIDCRSGESELAAFLAKTDILVSLLPHTPETHHLVDRKIVSRLRGDGALGGPVFINAGRGGTHNQAEIIGALKDGTLKGASLDVFETEPLPRDSELWTMKNVIITPHVAAWSSNKAVASYVAGQITRFRDGFAFANVVDRAKGY